LDLVGFYIRNCPVSSVEHQYLLLSSKYSVSLNAFFARNMSLKNKDLVNVSEIMYWILKRNLGHHFLNIILLM